MKKETNVSPEVIASNKNEAAEPMQKTTSFSEEERCEGEVEQEVTDASHQSESSPQGTPPSNTVPNNCNTEYFKLLRFGVDSLYLSYPGELLPEVDEELKELKQVAQSPELHEQAFAQYPINEHIFEVKSSGKGFFPYVLRDNAFHIQLSRSRSIPFAYVQISSQYLTHKVPLNAEKSLQLVLKRLGTIEESANVSRIDLFVDFVTSENMESWDRHAWVTRASAINNYSVEREFSGWMIGAGGVISCRLYNKTLEIKQSKKAYLLELWHKAGWNGYDPVWRLEFQLKREVLTQKGLGKLTEVIENLNGLWSYAATEWLRLTMPNGDDKTRSRWPIHPLWGYLSSVDWQTDNSPLLPRFTSARIPSNEMIFRGALSSLISFMAREQITNFDHGFAAYKLALCQHFEEKSFNLGLSFDDFIKEKIAIKARQFNTILNRDIEAEEKAKLDKSATEYRKQSDGE